MICQLIAAMRRALAFQRQGLDPHRLHQQTFDATSPRSTVAISLRARGVTSQGRTDIAAQSSARHTSRMTGDVLSRALGWG
jgi:hypothetical protein